MIADLKPYPAMKNSGVPWLGEVPEHWEVFPLKRVTRPESSGSYGVEPEQGELVLPVATTAQIDPDGVFAVGRMPIRGFSKSEADRYGCCAGDVLIVKSSGSAANVISGKAGIVRKGDALFVFSNFLLRLRATETRILPEYLFHSVTMNLARERVKMMVSATTYPNLKIDEYLSAAFPLPPLPEQAAIVRFLDNADRRIRRYVRAKQKLIKLLEEQKQAIIHRAITRGLDPNVRLKPSGVEWLGDVPEHWQIAKLVRLTTRIGDGLHGTPEYVDESEFHFINGNNLSSGAIKITPLTRCVSEVEFQKYRIALHDSTLLMSINGTIGNVAFYRGESLVLGKSAAYINCDKSLGRRFLFFFLQSSAAKEFFQLELTGTTIFNLSLASIRNLSVTLPPLTEQIDISSFLEAKMAEFDDLINRAKCGIAFLREYRTRLIADVVTGKLDVREAAARLPDDAEEPEPLDDADAFTDTEEDAVDDLDAVSEETEV